MLVTMWMAVIVALAFGSNAVFALASASATAAEGTNCGELSTPAAPQSEIEKVENEIKSMEQAITYCAEAMDALKPPGVDGTEAEWAEYDKELKRFEECIANLERRLDYLKELLAKLSARLPSTVGPREDPETKKLREKLAEWKKRVDEGERRKNNMKDRAKELQKNKKR